jgi:diaminohydroxyphosphoribosylaminopyrimidine deaminase/5-amino-6-(5-phosphoribosylamino)uracil reductase
MDKHEEDLKFVQRSLDLAAEGKGRVSPNPLVGCVIVSHDGKVVGEGTYIYDGVKHAEVIALEQAGEKARGATAYVSLEPHDHQNRTLPCTEALIDAGIRRVVSPIEDPNPLVSGQGFDRLRRAGIEVATGILEDEAAQLNEKFICWHRNRRPFVHLKLAMSLDGRISLHNSVSTALTSVEARARVQEIRHEHDAILIGGNTAYVDDPELTDRSGRLRGRPLMRVVLDNRLRLPLESKLVSTADKIPTLVFSDSPDDKRVAELQGRGVVVSRKNARDLTAVLECLRQREIQSVLVEGGTEVAGAFCDARLVDKVTFIFAPLIIGGNEAPPAVGGAGTSSLDNTLKLHAISAKNFGRDIEITGYPAR